MSQALEAGMLVCFGISWPMSLIKNIKAHTAKNMSIGFILLIIAGYISGIVAKLCSHTYGYILLVYGVNLVIVTMNLVVYFVNRRYDLNGENDNEIEGEINMKTTCAEAALSAAAKEKLGEFHSLNVTAEPNGIVFFGSGRFSGIDMAERGRELGIEQPVYNRSLPDLTVESAFGALDECVCELSPSQVLVGLGEEDIGRDGFDAERFIEDYRWLLYELHRSTDSKIFIVSIVSPLGIADEVNARLRRLAEDTGCTYVDATGIMDDAHPGVKLAELLRMFTRTHPITFCEAMRIGTR